MTLWSTSGFGVRSDPAQEGALREYDAGAIDTGAIDTGATDTGAIAAAAIDTDPRLGMDCFEEDGVASRLTG